MTLLRPEVRLDRVQFVCWAGHGWKLPNLPDFTVVFDRRVPQRGKIPTYGRCRMYRSTRDDTKVLWHYQRQRMWLKPWKVTIVADDKRGLRAEHVHIVMRYCKFIRILIVELALDFDASVMDQKFVRRHAIFGKSQRRKKSE